MLDSVIERPDRTDGLESADAVRSAVERYRDAVDRHDIDAAVAAFTDDGLIDCTPPPDGERYEGAVAIRALFRQLFGDPSDQRTFETEELIIAGDRAVLRWCHRWVDTSGRPGHVRGVELLRVRDGKIAEKLAYVKG
jgi:ketosteroid isomerase-like protein